MGAEVFLSSQRHSACWERISTVIFLKQMCEINSQGYRTELTQCISPPFCPHPPGFWNKTKRLIGWLRDRASFSWTRKGMQLAWWIPFPCKSFSWAGSVHGCDGKGVILPVASYRYSRNSSSVDERNERHQLSFLICNTFFSAVNRNLFVLLH